MTVLNRAQLTALVTSSLPDNSSGLITPHIMRTLTQDMVDSYQLLSEGIPGPTGPTGAAGAAGANGMIVTLTYDTLAHLNADLTPAANTGAQVVGDAVEANNGVYAKVGASGSGSWARYSDLNAVAIVNSGSKSIFAVQLGTEAVMSLDADMTLRVAGQPRPITQRADSYTDTQTTLLRFEDAAGFPIAAVDADNRLLLRGMGDVFSNACSADLVKAYDYEAFGDTSKSAYFRDKARSALAKQTRVGGMAIPYRIDANAGNTRFGSSVPISDTQGIVVAAQQYISQEGGENAMRLIVRDYTINYISGTITYSTTRVIDQPSGWITGAGGMATGPNGVRLASGRIIVVYSRSRSDTARYSDSTFFMDMKQVYSDDNGQTWSTPAVIIPAEQIYSDVGVSVPSSGFIGSVAIGGSNPLLLIPTGAHAGRLLLYTYTATSDRAVFYASDNNGVTWAYLGQQLFANADSSETYNEGSLAFCADSSIVCTLRHDTGAENSPFYVTRLGVGVLRSTDGGHTWSSIVFQTSGSVENVATALLNAAYSPATGFPKVMLGGGSDPHCGRINYLLRLSYDNGNTFVAQWSPFGAQQGISYSSLIRLTNGCYLLTFEAFRQDFNHGSAIGQIVFNDAHMLANSVLS